MVGANPVRYQWHIFLAALDPTRGAEQSGRRPVLVISREQINQLLPVVNVIPMTSRKSAESRAQGQAERRQGVVPPGERAGRDDRRRRGEARQEAGDGSQRAVRDLGGPATGVRGAGPPASLGGGDVSPAGLPCYREYSWWGSRGRRGGELTERVQGG